MARTPALIAAGVAAVAVATGGIALGYWAIKGQGSGSASTAGAVAITVTTNGTPATLLQPGSTGDLVITVSNPNNYSVKITSVSGTGTITSSSGTCLTTGVSVSVPGPDLPITVPANASNMRFVLAGAVSMSTASDSGCQNSTFTIPLSVTAQR